MDALLAFVREENDRLRARHGLADDRAPLAQAVKLTEEVGELASAVLARGSLQRAAKAEEATGLDEEVADVIITTLLLADTLDVDAEAALAAKTEAVADRYD